MMVPNTSRRHPAHAVYPYLLRHMEISRPNHVFAADIAYIPIKRGFVYLFAVMDWASRRVLAWRLSNTLTTDFCIEALQEAIHRYSKPDSFNTNQGSQFTIDALRFYWPRRYHCVHCCGTSAAAVATGLRW
jgi:putative transposase